MALGFGTSGVRGLVTELTDRECALYTRAFVQHARERGAPPEVSLAGDLRSSTPRVLGAVAWGVRCEGGSVDFCGTVPTPALAFHAMQRGRASIMVTGSHIPDDRNGIKFNLPGGEVLKSDEAAIAARYARLRDEPPSVEGGEAVFDERGMFRRPAEGVPGPLNSEVPRTYVGRYREYFPAGALAGRHVVLYEHSSAAREVLGELLETLGARVTRVGWSDRFVPVDTEAVEDVPKLAGWVHSHRADALVSADGDGDRPLVLDGEGKVVRGDVLGILVAAYLGADAVAAPVSCNTALERSGLFARVVRTRIGSPHVIAGMEEALRSGARRVVGFEANGGFLLASDVEGGAGRGGLKALPTRDAALPILAVLDAAARRGMSVAALVRTLPARFTCSGLIRPFPTEAGRALVERFRAGGAGAAEAVLGAAFGRVASLDFTDGARMTFGSGLIVHVRPSGNAPEFRVYTEGGSEAEAGAANETARNVFRRATPATA